MHRIVPSPLPLLALIALGGAVAVALGSPPTAIVVMAVLPLLAALRLGSTTPCPDIDQHALPSGPREPEALEVVVDLSVSPKGHAVEITTPLGGSARRIVRGDLPLDRGVGRLTTLAGTGEPSCSSPRADAIRQFGTELFGAVFVGAIEQLYRSSVDDARSRNRPLRIALRVDEALSDLPWEYLYDDQRATFLALSPESSVVRRTRPRDRTRPAAPASRLRVLIVRCSPRDLASLRVDREGIETDLEGIEVRTLDHPSLADLHAALDDFDPHVFHFCGHGRWNDDADDGVILLENEHGRQQPVTGRQLGALLNRLELRLAIFNGCDTGRTSRSDRFAGLAGSLVAQGIPAAIGMQFRMEDRAAATFGTAFLGRIANTRDLDAGLRHARSAVFALPNDVEWATPVLTSRIPLEHVLPPRTSEALTEAAGPGPTPSAIATGHQA